MSPISMALNCLHPIGGISFPHPSVEGRSSRFIGIHGLELGRPAAATTLVRSTVISAVTSDPAQAEVSWQIVVGALAGVAPFVVAGIEFSKRIVEQRKCKVCRGSGLVLRDNKYYFRCPGCGGFLPWQSWRRFFTG